MSGIQTLALAFIEHGAITRKVGLSTRTSESCGFWWACKEGGSAGGETEHD